MISLCVQDLAAAEQAFACSNQMLPWKQSQQVAGIFASHSFWGSGLEHGGMYVYWKGACMAVVAACMVSWASSERRQLHVIHFMPGEMLYITSMCMYVLLYNEQ